MMIAKRFLLVLVFLYSFSSNIFATEKGLLSDEEWLEQFEIYLAELGSIKGEFSQIDQFGKVSKGIFYSNGSGYLKFDYSYPAGMQINIKNGMLAFKESNKSKTNFYSLEDSPLSNLLSKNLTLKSFYIEDLLVTGKIATLELRTNKKSSRNSIFITTDYPVPKLRQWRIIDTQKKETTVFFSNIKKINSPMDSYFEIK